jgi:amino acid transporter
MEMNNPTKSNIGGIAAIVILLNMAFLGNNAYILLGVTLFLVVMAVYYFRKDKETLKLSPARITLFVLMVLVNVALVIYVLLANRPVPLSP